MKKSDVNVAQDYFREASEILGPEMTEKGETPPSEWQSVYNLAFGLEHLACAIRALQQEVKAVKDELYRPRSRS